MQKISSLSYLLNGFLLLCSMIFLSLIVILTDNLSNVRFDKGTIVSPSGWMEAEPWTALAVDDELLEIPVDVILANYVPHHTTSLPLDLRRRRTRILEKLVQGMCLVSVDIQFPVDVEVLVWLPAPAGAHVLEAVEDVLVSPGFLILELVTWEG